MKIIDTNTINYILANNIYVSDTYHITPDLKVESEISESIHGKRIPQTVRLVTEDALFDKAIYIDAYKQMLNKHGGRSFFNMTGFGDISILALMTTVSITKKMQKQKTLFEENDDVEVFTEDKGLIKKIGKEFKNKVRVHKCKDVK